MKLQRYNGYEAYIKSKTTQEEWVKASEAEALEKENEQLQSIAKVAIDKTEELQAEIERLRKQAEEEE